MDDSPRSSSHSGPRWWRVVAVLLLVGLAAGLLAVRPWDAPKCDCAVTVRPGESIQEAINAAGDGDVICLARGKWTENLVIDKSLTLVGWGAGRTSIGPDRFHLPVVEILGRNSEPISVKIHGISVSWDGGHTGVEVAGAASAELSRCRVSGMLYGIQAVDSASITLSNSSVSDSRQIGIVLMDSATASFNESRVFDSRRLGIRISGSARADLRDSGVFDNASHGLSLLDEATVTLTGCTVSDNGETGLLLVGNSTARVLMTEVSGNSDRGLKADEGATAELTGSSVLSNWHGVDLAGSARMTATDVDISANRLDGVRAESSAHFAISGSVLASNMRAIGLRGAATAQVDDCLIEDSWQYGIFSLSAGEVAGGGNRFSGNGMDLGGNLPGSLRLPLRERVETTINWPDERFESIQEAIDALLPGGRLVLEPGAYSTALTIGTQVSLEAAQGEVVLMGKSESLPVLSLVDGAELRLVGVTVRAGSTGLSLAGGARAELVGCTVTGNTQGVHLSNSASVDMSECSIAGNARSGVFATGAARATITGCSVSDHIEYGIAAANSAQLTVSDSVVTRCGWDGGIILWDSARAVLEGNSIINNRGYGVATYSHQCFRGVMWPFRGHISGRGNTVEENRRGDVCPPGIDFLSTPEGGELDLRPSSRP